MSRILALLSKEMIDLRSHPGLFVPAILTGIVSIALPFIIAIAIPRITGERLSDSADFELALEMYKMDSSAASLTPEGAVQAWIFRQFLVMLVFSPVAGAMSIAAYAVIGEKQSRTLEPLLATPLTTFELLAAKVLGALLPSLALTAASFGIYVAGVVALAEPGVHRALFAPYALSTVFIVGPLASLAALQLAVCVSSRASDARSAQQIGALIILPLSALLVAQLIGSVQVTTAALLAGAAALVVFNAVLMRVAMVLFDRETILTRWK